MAMFALDQKQTSAQVRHVRFTLKSGHWKSVVECPLRFVPKADIQAALEYY
jgi:hypothetical protein